MRVCPASVASVRNIPLDVIEQEPSLHSSVQGNFFFYIKVQDIGLGHFVISETLSPGDNRC